METKSLIFVSRGCMLLPLPTAVDNDTMTTVSHKTVDERTISKQSPVHLRRTALDRKNAPYGAFLTQEAPEPLFERKTAHRGRLACLGGCCWGWIYMVAKRRFFRAGECRTTGKRKSDGKIHANQFSQIDWLLNGIKIEKSRCSRRVIRTQKWYPAVRCE